MNNRQPYLGVSLAPIAGVTDRYRGIGIGGNGVIERRAGEVER